MSTLETLTALRDLHKGDKITVTPLRDPAPGMTYGEIYTLTCLGWMGGVCDFTRDDTGRVIPWSAFSRGFIRLTNLEA